MIYTFKDFSGLDLSIPTLTELMDLDHQIYELCQAIRHRLRIVVDLRLAAKITQAEYFDARHLSQIETTECSRRRSELLIEMTRRRHARQPLVQRRASAFRSRLVDPGDGSLRRTLLM